MTSRRGHQGYRTPDQGAQVVAHLAALPPGGPSGLFWGHVWTTGGDDGEGVLPW